MDYHVDLLSTASGFVYLVSEAERRWNMQSYVTAWRQWRTEALQIVGVLNRFYVDEAEQDEAKPT
jgi:hypothetical protein